MKKIILGGILLSQISYAFAYKALNLTKGHYNFLENIDDISFLIESDEINSLLHTKILLDSEEELKVQAFWYKGKKALKLIGFSNVPDHIQQKVKEIYIGKAAHVWGENFKEWIKKYDKKNVVKNTHIFEDPSGLLDKSEISITPSLKKIKIIQKQPTGTTITEYYYRIPPWSSGKKVLNNVKKSIYEGNRTTITDTYINYSKVSKGIWMPSEIKVNSTQGVNMQSNKPVERNVVETYKIGKYKINKKSAQKYIEITN